MNVAGGETAKGDDQPVQHQPLSRKDPGTATSLLGSPGWRPAQDWWWRSCQPQNRKAPTSEGSGGSGALPVVCLQERPDLDEPMCDGTRLWATRTMASSRVSASIKENPATGSLDWR